MIDRPAYFKAIEPFVGTNVIKVLTGVRRCGKSTLLTMLRDRLPADDIPPSNILHLCFESDDMAGISTRDDLTAYVRGHVDAAHPIRLFLDEIQEIDGWERALRSFMVDYDADIYVTGSNAHILSSDLATYITGRYVTIPVHPLSFAEFLPAYQAEHPGVDKRDVFRAYVIQGGFPFQHELGFNQRATLQYLTDLNATILLKDVVRRNAIRDVDMLERIVAYAIGEEGHILTPGSIAAYLKSQRRRTTQETVANHLKAAEQAYLIHRAQREDTAGKRVLAFSEKYYVTDPGLRQALGFDNAAGIDQVIEGIVYMELIRRGWQVSVGKVGDCEIDFIARKDGNTSYWQVTVSAMDPATWEREFGSLEAVHDHWPKTVLSLDDFPYSRNGIQGRNLIDWLLE